jgi:formylglycine-generating enzyme required for sulfatase activity
VWGGQFSRACDYSCQQECPGAADGFPAQLASFSLDAFEVTVGRFRRFVNAFPSSKPGEGTGENPNNAQDKGWNRAWNEYLRDTKEDFLASLSSSERCSDSQTWTNDVDANESMPMNCVTWYEALAFCIWDGGRLPTQAEWNYAAAGGSEQRQYPWGTTSDTVDSTYAIFASADNPAAGPAPVGTRPKGRGKWLQYDLAGNLAEWAWDRVETCYRHRTCATTAAKQRGFPKR